jgi:hypothetical protein
MTAVSGSVYTAAQFNTHVRDNLNETAVAHAANLGGYFVTAGTNQIVERLIGQSTLNASSVTSSTSYTDLDDGIPGPTVTLTTGSTALVTVGGRIGPNTVATPSTKMSWEVSGASSVTAADDWAAGQVNSGTTTMVVYTCRTYLATGLTPGVNTFTAKYCVSSGTGTYSVRNINVLPF